MTPNDHERTGGVDETHETMDEIIECSEDDLQGMIDVLEMENKKLLTEIEKLRGELVRSQADYQNALRRGGEAETRGRDEGVNAVFRSLFEVLDHFDRALAQDLAQTTVQQLADGVRIVRDELVRVWQSHGVREIRPQAGDEFDPMRHQALMRMPTPDQSPNTIVQCLTVGYARGEMVLRPAGVSVAGAPNG